MVRIGLLSDTHSFLDPELLPLLSVCDEIWHAGDVGNEDVVHQLQSMGKSLKIVYGNIDGREIRLIAPQTLVWQVEQMKILMTHIGGYPGHYPSTIKQLLLKEKPDIFVCGHSHILKVIYDKQLCLLHINPGACGKVGFQKVRTMVRFAIDGDKVKEMAVIELGVRQ
ncbi:MAG TPA: metallophosphoesterase family protein [Saprospiraceae bacterium]